MKKLLSIILFSLGSTAINAQYADIEKRLDLLEERQRENKNLKNEDINHKKFTLTKDAETHTERLIITINGNQATFVEVFDDKATGETTSNVFTGDIMRTNKNILSFRFDKLEGTKIPVPVIKNLLLLKERNRLYLIDTNTKEHWVESTPKK